LLSSRRKNTTKRLENRIRVGAVSYLNTKPLLWGIQHSEISRWISLSVDYPAEVARQLKSNEIDLGLVPVAIIPELDEYYIISDYCIGANGKVASVSLFSQVPLEQVETVLLDYQSRTSVALVKILFENHWHLQPEFRPAYPGYEEDINGKTAGVVIGDRAFVQRPKSLFEYDLSEAWKQMTGHPFVFAAWVANKELPEAFIDGFNRANEAGLNEVDRVIDLNPFAEYDLHGYFTKNLSYKLDEPKRAGLALFLDYLRKIKL
jgi:chorismate dehydratase